MKIDEPGSARSAFEVGGFSMNCNKKLPGCEEATMKIDERDEIESTVEVQPVEGEYSSRPRLARKLLVALAAALLVAGLVDYGLRARAQLDQAVTAETDQLAVPAVTVTHPKPESGPQEVVLPANIQPYINAPIFAQITGYLKQWYFDIGARVKKGQLLAVIEAPQVDQELQQARGNLATAEANLRISEITANRYTGLIKSDSVSQQATDTAVAAYQANKATVQADQANVRALEAQQAFENVYAPFDGVVTARNTDIGQLVDAGANGGPATELFDVAAIGVLRVYVSVPQIYSSLVRRGMPVDLTLPQFPNRRFRGTLVRTANAIDPASRTLLVEVDVNNARSVLLPGDYAEAHFKLPAHQRTLTLPDTALIFRSDGLQVGTVDNGRTAVLKNITVGQDFGTTVEVLTGVSTHDWVINNPPDSLVSGEAVRPVTPKSVGGQS
jgi:RND family efflux transporter MFP subunit